MKLSRRKELFIEAIIVQSLDKIKSSSIRKANLIQKNYFIQNKFRIFEENNNRLRQKKKQVMRLQRFI